MTIHDLRGMVHVTTWINDDTGATIYYDVMGDTRAATCNISSLLSELIAISAIESDSEYLDNYKLSQWDALNLAIRHEYAKFIEADIENSDIGKSINKIIKRLR